MSNPLNKISQVYLDQVANIKKIENEDDVNRWTQTEAVKGQDTEMRKVKAAERREKGDTRHTPKEAERAATYTKGSINWWDKKTQKEERKKLESSLTNRGKI